MKGPTSIYKKAKAKKSSEAVKVGFLLFLPQATKGLREED